MLGSCRALAGKSSSIRHFSRYKPDILTFLVRKTPKVPAATPDLQAWWLQHQATRLQFSAPIDRALAGGFLADRVGFAFQAGYQSALGAMFPDLSLDKLAAFVVTEEGGGRPSAIQTAVSNAPGAPSGSRKLDGVKTFALSEAEVLLVVARDTAAEQERGSLRVAVVFSDAPGVKWLKDKAIKFIPEVRHAEVSLESVVVDEWQVLAGDAYIDYVKPFRTIEDVHVMAAILGYLIRISRATPWPPELTERLLAACCSLRTIAAHDALEADTHLALAGTLHSIFTLVDECEPFWSQTGGEAQERWKRDKCLLKVASNVREQRRRAAWDLLEKSANGS